MIGIILAAGDGARFNDSTGYVSCKAMNKINDKYLIQFSLDNLVSLGITECIIVVGSFSDVIRNFVKDNYKGIKIRYVEQTLRKGVIHALICAISQLLTDECIVLQLADEVFSDFNSEAIIATVEKKEYDFYCGITYEDNKEKIKTNYSVEVDVSMQLTGCTEKPEAVTNNIKGTGFCVFNKNCLAALEEIYNETENIPYDLCDYMNHLISFDKKGLCIPVAQKEFNINTYDELKEATDYFSVQED